MAVTVSGQFNNDCNDGNGDTQHGGDYSATEDSASMASRPVSPLGKRPNRSDELGMLDKYLDKNKPRRGCEEHQEHGFRVNQALGNAFLFGESHGLGPSIAQMGPRGNLLSLAAGFAISE